MSSDPFARGPNPVGARSELWTDSERERDLEVEIWYPAAESVAGRDLDPVTQDAFTPGWVLPGAEPMLARQSAVRDAPSSGEKTRLVLLIHGWAGYRRESTFLGTHLASHGYTVVSPDVPGSTYQDTDALLGENGAGAPPEVLMDHIRDIALGRQDDIPFLISSAADRLNVDTSAVGVTGASFGGYSALIAPAVDPRVEAIVPMCPAGGQYATTASGGWSGLMRWDWHRPAPTLFLVADRDSLLPLHSQLDLLRRAPTPNKRMVVLADADHNHFVDEIDIGQEWLREYAARVAAAFPDGPGNWDLVARSVVPSDQLCPGEHAHLAWRGLTVAHMNAYLREDPDSKAIVDGPVDAILAQRGVTTNTIDGTYIHDIAPVSLRVDAVV